MATGDGTVADGFVARGVSQSYRLPGLCLTPDRQLKGPEEWNCPAPRSPAPRPAGARASRDSEQRARGLLAPKAGHQRPGTQRAGGTAEVPRQAERRNFCPERARGRRVHTAPRVKKDEALWMGRAADRGRFSLA